MVKRHVFPTFEWIDFTNSYLEEIEKEVSPIGLEATWIEDSLERGHLPKFEQRENMVFFILRAHAKDTTDRESTVEGISNKLAIFLLENTLITIHREPFPFFPNHLPPMESAEEWMISLMNLLILTYDEPIDNQIDQLDQLEKQIFFKKSESIPVEALYLQKNKARISKRILLFMQHVLHQWEPSPTLRPKYQDIKDSIVDHLLHYDEIMDSSNALVQTALSLSSQKSNEVMKLLTVISVFFLPLTFLVGVYGMNFDYMPELHLRYGYPLTWGVMLISCLLIYLWFKRKKII
ncbi:MAG: CorA family divalent cation transporter [Spirosomataceae bacterium]